MRIARPLLVATLVMMLAGAAGTARASVLLDEPAVSPSTPIAGQPVSARVVVYPLCSLDEVPDFAVVRIGTTIELRYIEKLCDSVQPPAHPVQVPLGVLEAGSYGLRLVEVSDAQHPFVAGSALFTVSSTPCGPDALCLQGGRFAVTAQWRTTDGATGTAHPRAINDETGSFWFFTPGNQELMVKVLDGCALNNRFWLYAAGLTDVAVTLHVVDNVGFGYYDRTYTTPAGQPFAPIVETQSFQCTCENCSR